MAAADFVVVGWPASSCTITRPPRDTEKNIRWHTTVIYSYLPVAHENKEANKQSAHTLIFPLWRIISRYGRLRFPHSSQLFEAFIKTHTFTLCSNYNRNFNGKHLFLCLRLKKVNCNWIKSNKFFFQRKTWNKLALGTLHCIENCWKVRSNMVKHFIYVLTSLVLKSLNWTHGPVAQRITRLPTEQKIPGSNPGRFEISLFTFMIVRIILSLILPCFMGM